MKKWIQFKFRFNHPAEWWIDLFVIDTAIRNALIKHSIELWRFHRRSARDSVGHQLSFLCFTDESTAEKIKKELFDHHSIGLLEKYSKLKSKSIEVMKLGIENTSDAGWSIELQKSWPYFIMGTSMMILELLAELEKKRPNFKECRFSAIENHYSKLNDKLISLCMREGSHAFFHHICALFDCDRIIMRV